MGKGEGGRGLRALDEVSLDQKEIKEKRSHEEMKFLRGHTFTAVGSLTL